MTRYVTVTQLKDYLRNEKATEDDSFYEEAIEAAETAIDNECHRRFIVATTSSARTYAPCPNSSILKIHDCTGVTSVVENSATLSVGTHFQLEPLNALSSAGETVPYYRLRRLDTSWYTRGNRGTVVVTAAWGWAAIPPQIIEACKIGAKAYIDGRDIRLGLAGLADGGAFSPRETRIVKNAMDTYTRDGAFIA